MSMKWTQDDLDKYNNRQAHAKKSSVVTPERSLKPINIDKAIVGIGQEAKTPPQSVKKKLVIELAMKLPTWNLLLQSGVWKRKQIRDKIHKAVADAVSLLSRTASV